MVVCITQEFQLNAIVTGLDISISACIHSFNNTPSAIWQDISIFSKGTRIWRHMLVSILNKFIYCQQKGLLYTTNKNMSSIGKVKVKQTFFSFKFK